MGNPVDNIFSFGFVIGYDRGAKRFFKIVKLSTCGECEARVIF